MVVEETVSAHPEGRVTPIGAVPPPSSDLVELAELASRAALGLASLLPSKAASRVLIGAVLVNPIDAFRTGALLAIQGTTAFGAASLAFLRFTNGPLGAAVLLAASAALWLALPAVLAARRLERADL